MEGGDAGEEGDAGEGGDQHESEMRAREGHADNGEQGAK